MKACRKYQLARVITMITPLLCAIMLVFNLILNFNWYEYRIINYISGTSIIVWVYFLLMGYVFNLCTHHRMFTYYLIFANGSAIIDYYYTLPLTTENYYLMLFLGFGISVLLYGYLKFRDNRELTNKSNKNDSQFQKRAF